MGALEFLYESMPGRLLLAPLVSRPVSRLVGAFLDTSLSKPLIKPFVKRNSIDLNEYLLDGITSFNGFFTRPIKPGRRPVDMSDNVLVSPCDGLLSVHRIERDSVYPVKQAEYRISDLVRDKALAERFDGGCCFVFRLQVEHYHRYIYPVSGTQENTVRIKGVYHTVRPIALRTRPVFIENRREYTVLHSGNDTIVQVEVGALLVGRIVNHRRSSGAIERLDEKGMFEYGGSTIILLTEPGSCTPFDRYADGAEHPVKLGEAVARFGCRQGRKGT